MGQLMTVQPKEMRVIYVTERQTGRVFPLAWPARYEMFLADMRQLFPRLNEQKIFLIKDAVAERVHVVSQSTFAGLVPMHKESGTIHVYYISVDV